MDFINAQFRGLSFEGLLLWKRPAATGLVVGFLGLSFFLFKLMHFSLISLFSYGLALSIILGFGFSLLGRNIDVGRQDISDHIHDIRGFLEPRIISLVSYWYDIISWKNRNLSLQFLAGSLVLGFVSGWVNQTFFFLFSTVALFTLPVILERRGISRGDVRRKVDQVQRDVQRGVDKVERGVKQNIPDDVQRDIKSKVNQGIDNVSEGIKSVSHEHNLESPEATKAK